MTDTPKNQLIDDVIKFFGSQAKLAKALDVSQSAVSQWLNNRAKISADNAEDVEKLTDGKFTKSMLRPHRKNKTP